jgi:hypothetical protein
VFGFLSSRTLDAVALLTYDETVNRSQVAGIILTLVVLAAIAWRLHGPASETPPVAVIATAPPRAPRPNAATASPTEVTIAHRLAGVALGNVRYAVVEQPDGATALYRDGDDVPGLGKIVEVTENSATFEGSSGRVRLSVKPPPSPSPAPASPTRGPQEALTPEASKRSPSPDRSVTGSPPSTASGQPAS